MQFLNIRPRPRRREIECAKRKDSCKLFVRAFRLHQAGDRIVGRGYGLIQVAKAIIELGKSGLNYLRERALITRYLYNIPGHQDGYHDVDGSGSKMEGFVSSVRVALCEEVAKLGLTPVGPRDPPRRNRLQIICNRIVFEPFLESGLLEKVRGDVLLAESI